MDKIVDKKLEDVGKEIDRVKAIQAVQNQGTGRTSVERRGRLDASSASRSKEDFEGKFWLCRRSIRIWPIKARDENALWAGVSHFFFEKLQIPQEDLPQEAVEAVTRVMPGRKKQKIEHEVIVRFSTVQMRDMIVSYAPNLREWRDKDGSSQMSAGLRLEIPDHLMAVFKTLEKFGHYLRDKHKEGLRCHIRYEDMNMSLVMDFALPGQYMGENRLRKCKRGTADM